MAKKRETSFMDIPEFKLKLNFGTYYFLNQGYLLKIVVYSITYTDTAHIIPVRGVMPTIQQNT